MAAEKLVIVSMFYIGSGNRKAKETAFFPKETSWSPTQYFHLYLIVQSLVTCTYFSEREAENYSFDSDQLWFTNRRTTEFIVQLEYIDSEIGCY